MGKELNMGRELNDSIFSRAVLLFSTLVSGPLAKDGEDGWKGGWRLAFIVFKSSLESLWSIRIQGDGSTVSHDLTTT